LSKHFRYFKGVTVPLPLLDEQRRIRNPIAGGAFGKRQESMRLTEEFLRWSSDTLATLLLIRSEGKRH
jgi:hypothetical protein